MTIIQILCIAFATGAIALTVFIILISNTRCARDLTYGYSTKATEDLLKGKGPMHEMLKKQQT